MNYSRRTFLQAASGLMVFASVGSLGPTVHHTRTGPRQWHHGLSLFGDLKYPPAASPDIWWWDAKLAAATDRST